MTEINALRKRIEELEQFEKRCLRAEAALKASEERNQLLGDSAPLGIFTVDREGSITETNRTLRELFSTSSHMQSEPSSSMEHIDQAIKEIGREIEDCIEQRKTVTVESMYTGSGDGTLHLRYNLSPIVKNDGGTSDVIGVMGIVENYSALKRAEESIRESERRYRQLFQSAPIAIIEWDVSNLKSYLAQLAESGVSDFRTYLRENPQEVHHCWGLIKTADFNQAFLELMGISSSTLPNGAFLPTDTKEVFEMVHKVVLMAAEGQTAVEREETIVTTSGKTKVVLGKSLVVSGHEDTLERVAIAMVDISQRKEAEKALRESERRFREQAFRDGLTGLYNQRYLYQSLDKLIASAGESKGAISLLFIDLDHFKKVVDTYGHLNGSRAIYEVAQTINSCLKEPSYAVAYAGDEFVVVLPEMDLKQAQLKASEIRAKVRESVYLVEDDIKIKITASFGIATFPQHATDMHGLIAAADQALFAVKETGKDAIGEFQAS